jgi:hypothetical protein
MNQRLQEEQERPIRRSSRGRFSASASWGGPDGAGIAGAHVRRGIPVVMLDAVPAALEKGVAAITKSMQGRVDIGRMGRDEMIAALGRLSTTTTLAAMADRDLVIEAVVENERSRCRSTEAGGVPADAIARTPRRSHYAKAIRAEARRHALFQPGGPDAARRVIRGERPPTSP